MLFKVDENRDLAALAIGDELDASHGFILHASYRYNAEHRNWIGHPPSLHLSVRFVVDLLSKLLSRKQKSLRPAYNSCSRFHLLRVYSYASPDTAS